MTIEGIRMEFMGCARLEERNAVTCHLKLTSIEGFDRSIEVFIGSFWASHTKASLIDATGNTYEVSELVIGTDQITRRVDYTLLGDVPTLAKYKFINVSSNDENLAQFKPAFKGTGNVFYSDFRDIKF